jgi:uncharacterized RDD family membrane protein YckC
MIAIGIILLVITILAASVAGLFHAGDVALLLELILTFILLAGYFLISEAAWNGQTLGKRALRLRVVGDQGQPLTIGQAAVRNLIRVVDFLPLMYAFGIVVMFLNRRAKRLGDFAAGTLVVRDKQRINLYDLSSQAAKTQPEPPAPSRSIWSTESSPSIWSTEASTEAAPPPPTQPMAPLSPALRRLVVAYAARRESLPANRREALAKNAEVALRAVLPDVVATAGPLAALDTLAEREGVSPLRPMHGSAGAAMAWGVTSLVFLWFPPVGVPTGILSILFGNRAVKAIRREPTRYQGADRARTGRVLGIIGLALSSVIALLFIIGIIFRNG